MPDIGALLRAGVDGVPAPPDLVRIQGRADALRRRQTTLRSSLVLGVVALVVAPLVHYSGGRDTVEQVPSTEHSVSANPTSDPAVPPGPAIGHPSGAAAVTSSSNTPSDAATAGVSSRPAVVEPTAPRPTLPPVPSRTPEPGASPAAYPAGTSCQVSTAGLDRGQTRSCRYEATAPGGWTVSGVFASYPGSESWVEVIRGGRTMRWTDACSDDGIRVGDLVTATVRSAGQEDVTVLQVGSGHHC